MNKQNSNRLTDTENRLRAAAGEGGWGLGERGAGSEKCRVTITR